MTTSTPGPTAHESRFSIRVPRPLWIFLATVVLVVAAAGLRAGLSVHRRQLVLSEIGPLGGTMVVRATGPAWFRTMLGVAQIKAFGEIELNLNGAEVTDDDLAQWGRDLERLPGLSRLHLAHSQITDAGIGHLIAIPDLEELNFDHTQVTDAGLLCLKDLKSLRRLSIKGILASDDGLYDLSRALPAVHIDK